MGSTPSTGRPIAPVPQAPIPARPPLPAPAPIRPVLSPVVSPVAPISTPVKIPVPSPVIKPIAPAPVRPQVRVPVPVPVPVRTPIKAPAPAPTPVRTPVRAPVPVRVPVRTPVSVPVRVPTKAPVPVPVRAPVKVPLPVPVPARPVSSPAIKPAVTPIKAPVRPSTKAPTRRPTKRQTKRPTNKPTNGPVKISVPTTQTANRINAGGVAYTDTSGKKWQADDFFFSGTQYNAGIEATVEDGTLYSTERYFNIWLDPQPFLYQVPVSAPGEYAVILHFMETFFQFPGQRVFDVWVEGQLFMDALDIVAAVGSLKPLIIDTTAMVTDGSVTIEFVAQVENPKISALEVMPISQYEPPISAPTVILAPLPAPAPSPAPIATSAWNNIYINCGGLKYLSNDGLVTWQTDVYFQGGSVYADGSADITPTADDPIFQTERHGTFSYDIPVPVGNYEITVHLAELYHKTTNARKFKLTIEDTVFNDVDIVQLGGGARFKSVSLETVAIVSDGKVTIKVEDSFPKLDQGKISAIEIKLVGPHLAHSVANGPYRAVDIDGSGTATIMVDGTPSHTHAPGLTLSSYTWKLGATIIGSAAKQNITLPVGEHNLALTVTDSAGNENTEATTVKIFPFGYPAVLGISPTSGSISGGNLVTITGSGFTYSASQTIVHFGLTKLSGNAITVVNANTITLIAPPTVVGAPVAVSVETPLEVSNSASYNYLASVPINFASTFLYGINQPTVVKFGPDRNLYVGTIDGKLARLTLNEDYTAVIGSITSTVAKFRCILGIAFNPMDTKPIPDVYITTSFFFHGSPTSSSGQSVNGNVKKISGANLDVIADVITGLPVSDHDHGVTNIEFGFHGEVYFGLGSNTNGGKPGQLTGSQLQKEGYYSAAIIKADISSPNFNGKITYDSPDDGSPNGGVGISVFCAGVRNPFGLTMHSNGELYGTDNGPNLGYGDMTTGCGPDDFIADVEEEDKVLHLKQGNYYGHPNPKRAADDNDPRQCVWRSQLEPSDADHTAPIVVVKSSTDGIMEYTADSFGGQLRGNLILSVYQGPLYRVILTPNGEAVIPQSNPAILLVNADSKPVGLDGLDVCQAPNGNLIEARISSSAVFVHKPVEPFSSVLKIQSVFPTIGGVAGGYILDIYGINFPAIPNVTVQGLNCPVVSSKSTLIQCTVPAGSVGITDVVVVSGEGGVSSTFSKGFRFITGSQ